MPYATAPLIIMSFYYKMFTLYPSIIIWYSIIVSLPTSDANNNNCERRAQHIIIYERTWSRNQIFVCRHIIIISNVIYEYNVKGQKIPERKDCRASHRVMVYCKGVKEGDDNYYIVIASIPAAATPLPTTNHRVCVLLVYSLIIK